MCYFITVILPDNADIKTCTDVFRQHHIALYPFTNTYLQKQLDKYLIYCMTKTCDCGTIWGKWDRPKQKSEDIEAKIKKLHHKGWSDAKIERWRANKREARKHQSDSLRIQRKDDESLAEVWVSLISSVINKRYAKKIGFLLHWYSGRFEHETFDIDNIITTNMNNLNSEIIIKAREDVLYLFTQ